MNMVCPECKNTVDTSSYGDLALDTVVECDKCGISLIVTSVEGDEILSEVVDEGK